MTLSVPAGQRAIRRSYGRPLAGLATVVVFAAVVAIALTQFRGGFTETVPVTVVSDRAGLMMNPGAKVKLHGAPVGAVASIHDMPNGQAAIQLALDPSRLRLIPANVLVNIVATTAFGAKFVQLIPPQDPPRNACAPARSSTPIGSPSRSTRSSRNSLRCWPRSTRPSSTKRSARWPPRSTGGAVSSANCSPT